LSFLLKGSDDTSRIKSQIMEDLKKDDKNLDDINDEIIIKKYQEEKDEELKEYCKINR